MCVYVRECLYKREGKWSTARDVVVLLFKIISIITVVIVAVSIVVIGVVSKSHSRSQYVTIPNTNYRD